MDRRRFLELSLATTAMALAGCEDRSIPQLDFHIDWTPGVDYIGFYAARERGHFARAGYDVRIVPGQGAEAAAQLLARRRIGIGTTTVDAYLRAYRAGQFDGPSYPRLAAVIFEKNPVVILTPASRPVLSPDDLTGRRIGYSEETSVTFRQLQLLIARTLPETRIRQTVFDDSVTVAENEVVLVQVGYDGPRRLMGGSLDAIVAYATDAPVELRRQGYDYRQRYLSDFGLDMPGMCVCISPAVVERDAAIDLVRAATEGWDYVRDHPESAVQILAALFPEIRADEAQFSLAQTLPLLPAAPGYESYGASEVLLNALQRSNTLLDRMEGRSVRIDYRRLTL
jgi:ABC-type nitrate/sulfonate/bicarbonate transport system substrate-binding protein